MTKKNILLCWALSFCFVIFASSTTVNAGTVRCQVNLVMVGTTPMTVDALSNPVSGHTMVASPATSTYCPGWEANDTNPAKNNFFLNSTNGDAMLATALTALSLGQPVYIHSLDDTFGNWAVVEQIYVAAP